MDKTKPDRSRTNGAHPKQKSDRGRTNEALPEQKSDRGRTNGARPKQKSDCGRTNEARPKQKSDRGRTNGALPKQKPDRGRTNEALPERKSDRGRTKGALCGRKPALQPALRKIKRALRILVPVLAALLVLCMLFALVSGSRGKKRQTTDQAVPDQDITPPEIVLQHREGYYVIPGLEYEEEGYRASDDRDGDLTEQVECTRTGETIVYRVKDRAGNAAVEYRRIPVLDPENWKPAAVDPSGKIVHLTFDDGPGQYTQRLLDILDRYGVQATFFVTHGFPVYEDMIKAEAAAGHSIGIHTYTHDFAKIYADDKAFWKDIEKMQKVVVKETGQRTNLMRFAGGSSNTASADYTSGIMTLLTKQAKKKGYHYFDWNVSCGDGGNESTTGSVITNIISQVQNYDESVVLCHDTKEDTVNAMEYLIPWLLDNGYTLLPLTSESETAHHAVQN